jgi:hypothetical protein
MEGTIPTPGVAPCTPAPPYVPPVFDYDHSGGRCSITGGYVVRNHDLESLWGRYVYTDYCGDDIRSLVVGPGTASDDSSTGASAHSAYSFGEDSCGHLYVTTGIGEVFALLDDGAAFTPCPEPPPPTPASRDVTPPRLQLARKFRQSLRTYRSWFVRIRCDERCGVTASATLRVPGIGRRIAVRAVTRTLRPRKLTRLRLILTRYAATAARRALREGGRVRATITVVARDAAGNQAVKRKPVRALP